MKKVLIIGSGGAGKSTFARRLGDLTQIEVLHLDRFYWQPDWTGPPKSEWRETVETLLEGDEWIMDGNYGGTLPIRFEQCDTAILLDLPNYICVWRVLKRIALYRQGGRPDMAEGCEERFDWKFLKWIWNYPTHSKPNVEALLKRFENEKNVSRLQSNREVENFFMNLKADKVKSK